MFRQFFVSLLRTQTQTHTKVISNNNNNNNHNNNKKKRTKNNDYKNNTDDNKHNDNNNISLKLFPNYSKMIRSSFGEKLRELSSEPNIVRNIKQILKFSG